MIALFILIGFVTTAFVVGLVGAEIVDRRRSLEIVADASRFPPRVVATRPRYL
jgi:hypothetical protein